MEPITVHTTVHAPLSTVWEYWNKPEHISSWAHASSDWAAEGVTNALEVGGRFKTRMFAKDGSTSFDFEGTYTAVEHEKMLAYTMDDGRTVSVSFAQTDDGILVTETFDPETENSRELQESGWQSILDNFKKYVECH